jgi:hypothetical protein
MKLFAAKTACKVLRFVIVSVRWNEVKFASLFYKETQGLDSDTCQRQDDL